MHIKKKKRKPKPSKLFIHTKITYVGATKPKFLGMKNDSQPFVSPSVVVAGVAYNPSEGVIRLSRGHGQHVADRQRAVDVVELHHLRCFPPRRTTAVEQHGRGKQRESAAVCSELNSLTPRRLTVHTVVAPRQVRGYLMRGDSISVESVVVTESTCLKHGWVQWRALYSAGSFPEI